MASTNLRITDIGIDRSNDIWITGRDINKYNGDSYNFYNFQNSKVPSNSPYYLDTRSISIDRDGVKWVGCAVSPYLSQVGVFSINDEYAEIVDSWTFNEMGITGGSLETSLIYASPYGNEILAFVCPLNQGAGVTGSDYIGTTGGNLYRHEKGSNIWEEVIKGKVWDHIYDIKSTGYNGNGFEYWIATESGIYIFDGGSRMYMEEILDGAETIKNGKLLNSYNSPLPSDRILSIDFDIEGNAWVGTDDGICYITKDGRFSVWKNSTHPLLIPAGEISVVKSISNGQVFFAAGNGYFGNGTGLYYFNGNTTINYTDSNSSLVNNNVTEIISFVKKSINSTKSYYPDEILLAIRDEICILDFIIPHVYASANDVGAPGWNFIEHKAFDSSGIPKVDKYSWVYPSWRTYHDYDLSNSHPGLDSRNLFLTTNLSDIADGSAGTLDYWREGPVEDFANYLSRIPINDPSWVNGITGPVNNNTAIEVNSVILGERYISAYNIISQASYDPISIGLNTNGIEVFVYNPNPANGSTGPTGPNDMGFLVYYNKFGQIEGSLVMRGEKTYIMDIKNSPDNESLYILGAYNKNIQIGEFIWGGSGGGSEGGGPIGSPIGLTNIAYPGITGESSEYPWILDSYTGSTAGYFLPSWYSSGSGSSGYFIMEIDSDLGGTTSYEDIDFSDLSEVEKKFKVKNFRYFPTDKMSSTRVHYKGSIEVTKDVVNVVMDIQDEIVYTYVNGYSKWEDSIEVSPLLGNDKGSYSWTSAYMSFHRDLRFKNAFSASNGSEVSSEFTISSVSTEGSNGSTIITGNASGSFTLNNKNIISTSGSDIYSWYILLDVKNIIYNYSIYYGIPTSPSPVVATSDRSLHYIICGIKGSTGDVFGTERDYIKTEYGLSLISVNPLGTSLHLGTYEVGYTGPSGTETLLKVTGIENSNSFIYAGIRYYDLLDIYKFDKEGAYPSEFISNAIGASGSYSTSFAVSKDDNVFVTGTIKDTGITGGGSINVPSEYIGFSSLSIADKPKIGKAKGDIISRPGQGSWRWCDVHRDGKNMKVPMLSTIFFVNYNSNIFGKNNYRWVLSDHKTGNIILDVKESPYFIFTFDKAGFYTLYNSVEDSEGNVYEMSKNAYIEVINHTAKTQDNIYPDTVNSTDYDKLITSPLRSSRFADFNKDLRNQQIRINEKNEVPFGSAIVIKNNRDATFRND
jgi:hypothetical protein